MLTLFGVWAASMDADLNTIIDWLTEAGLEPEQTPRERSFLAEPTTTPQRRIDLSWFAEPLGVLLWALGLLESLPSSEEVIATAIFRQLLLTMVRKQDNKCISKPTQR